MNKIPFRLHFLLVFFLFALTSSAQLRRAAEGFFSSDTLAKSSETVRTDSDSVRIAALEASLAESRLNEANMRMELEQARFKLYAGDSIELSRQRQRIDSLRRTTKGVPVVVDGDTLFYFYAKRGGYTPAKRAEDASSYIEEVGKRLTMKPDSVWIDRSDIISDIMYKDKVLFSVTDMDALWYGVTRDSLSAELRTVVVHKLEVMKSEYGALQLVRRIGYLLLILVAQYFLFRLTIWLFRKLRDRIPQFKLKPFMFRGIELIDIPRQVKVLVFISGVLKYVVMALQLLVSVPLIFVIFPQTEGFAYKLLGYIWSPVKTILMGIVDYIPNLFTIIVIWYVIKSLVRLLHYLAREVEAGRLNLGGFYPDWAMPTYHIIRFMLYAFMVAMIYPYLPGSQSGVFQGVSVFVGLIISLGSSTVMGNIIAGLVITYMRPFKLGDRIKLNDTTGDIIEKTPLVTRIRTPKNEVVTVPNSFIMSSHTVNYSASARDYGLIIHSEVTIGYDAPWRQVHQLLIEAALNTPGVTDDPRPFVLETSLSDWYPVYQLNAYIKDASKMPRIYSDLHQNIQDRFNEAGVEIMSPHYFATRDGGETTIPKDDMRSRYSKDGTPLDSKK